jgi:transketolase
MSLKDFTILGNNDTRSGFGEGMSILADQNQDVVALCADLTDSLKLGSFKSKAPERFIQCGIAEANMIGLAAGLAIGGKIPFATSFANFVTGRVYDQIRQSVAYSNKNVKICASHAGLTLGEDGATHQILEDIGLMQMLPNMTVIHTCDYNQTLQATLAVAEWDGPVYLRFGRPKMPIFIKPDAPFIIGKAQKINEGKDLTIHTIKPLDTEAILESVSKTKKVVVAEEHQRLGGLASTVALFLAENLPTPMRVVAVQDTFGESGTPGELMTKYHLDTDSIVSKSKELLK